MKNYFKNSKILAGSIMIGIIFILMIIGFFFTPYDFAQIDVTNKLDFFSFKHILGTDDLGRDILSRFMIAARESVFIGFASVLIGLIVGTLMGAFAGYFGGVIDEIIQKIIDTLMAFPGILIALMIVAVLGSNENNIIIALSIMSMPKFARISRSGFIKYKSADFIRAEVVRGAGTLRIMFLHILPNIFSELIVTATLGFSSAIISEAGLSYLGIGANPLVPTFGKMLSDAQNVIFQAPWYVFIPTGAITMLVLGFNLIADGLREINAGEAISIWTEKMHWK